MREPMISPNAEQIAEELIVTLTLEHGVDLSPAACDAIQTALDTLSRELKGRDQQIGELLQAVSARTSERDQAREAMAMLDTAYSEEHQRVDTLSRELERLTEDVRRRDETITLLMGRVEDLRPTGRD